MLQNGYGKIRVKTLYRYRYPEGELILQCCVGRVHCGDN